MTDQAAPLAAPADAAPQTAPKRSRSALALLLKGGALLAAVAAVIFALVAFIPDETDILLVSRAKNARLAALPSPKIVLIGGSNLAYGADSLTIEETTSCPVVNMGLNGFLGARFLLSEPVEHLESGDLAVIAFEYDTFFSPADGRPDSLFGVAKARTEALELMTWKQRLQVLQLAPYIAQAKVLRLLGEAERIVLNGLSGREIRPADYPSSEEEQFVAAIETLAGFNDRGDLTSHLDVDYPYINFDGLDLTPENFDPATVDLVIDFVRRMEARGVRVLVSFTPTARDYYEANRWGVDEVHRRLVEAVPDAMPRPPEDFLFDRGDFFDTVYHLRREPRAERSRMLADDIAGFEARREGGCAGAGGAAEE